MNKTPVFDVIIPVYKPDDRFFELMRRVLRQTVLPRRVILMNTEELLWDTAGAENRLSMLGADGLYEVHHVRKCDFDHGGTRNAGVSYSEAPYFVMMTNDAVPADRHLFEHLLRPLTEAAEASKEDGSAGQKEGAGKPGSGRIGISYARQLPNESADPLEAVSRQFNYPPESRVKTIEDLPKLGIKTYFASNVCAAYDRDIFNALGGFISRTIFNEDMIYAAKLMKAGYAVSYTANARVRHSHNYGPVMQFRRNFDLAVSQADHPEVFGGIKSESEGIRLVKSTAAALFRQGFVLLLPKLVVLSGAKYLGYRLGKNYHKLPCFLVRRLTMNQSYWEKQDE